MAWLRVESALPSHRKVLEAGQRLGRGSIGRVLGLWTVGACYAVAHLTDGFVPAIVFEDTRIDRNPGAVVSAMVASGLIHEEEGGYRLHDFHHYNPSAAKVKAKRQADLARKNPQRFHAESPRMRQGIAMEILGSESESDSDSESDETHTGAPVSADPPAWRANGRSDSLVKPPHVACFDMPAACARGVCLPRFLGEQWRAQLGGDRVSADAEIRAFVDRVLAKTSGPVGADPLKFWRAQWEAAHGGVSAARPGKGQQAVDAFAEAARKRLGGQA